MPCSMRKARIWLIVAVRRETSRARTPVTRLQVELVLALLLDEAQVRPHRRLSNGLGIVVIVLLSLNERLHVDCRDDPRLVTELA